MPQYKCDISGEKQSMATALGLIWIQFLISCFLLEAPISLFSESIMLRRLTS